MDVGTEGLTYRGTVGTLTSPLKMVCHLRHNVAVEGPKRMLRVTATKVVGLSSLPPIDIRNHLHYRHEERPGRVMSRIVLRAFAIALRLGKMFK